MKKELSAASASVIVCVAILYAAGALLPPQWILSWWNGPELTIGEPAQAIIDRLEMDDLELWNFGGVKAKPTGTSVLSCFQVGKFRNGALWVNVDGIEIEGWNKRETQAIEAARDKAVAAVTLRSLRSQMPAPKPRVLESSVAMPDNVYRRKCQCWPCFDCDRCRCGCGK